MQTRLAHKHNTRCRQLHLGHRVGRPIKRFTRAAATAGQDSLQLPSVRSISCDGNSTDALDSEDLVHTVPLHVFTRRSMRQQLHPRKQEQQWQLEQFSLAAAHYCYPAIAASYAVAGTTLLASPAHGMLLFGAAHAASSTFTADALAVTFAQLLGATYILQGAIAVVVQGCAARGQLHGTTCQRLLLASLLAMTGNIMSLGKVALGACTAEPAVWLLVLLGTFCTHVACHLPHHPWFLVKVLWPVATTMAITDMIQLLAPAIMGGGGLGAGRLQALAAAVLSVKAFSKLSRLAAGAAPKVARRVLAPAGAWLTKRTVRLMPVLARRLGALAPRITRLGGRLAGGMAPRYAQDTVVGRTMNMAFPSADGGMTQAVARSIDLLPPKTPAACVYTCLLVFQLMMIVNAYCPDLLFNTAAPALAVQPAAAAAAAMAAVAAPAAATPAAAATVAGTASTVATATVTCTPPVLHLVKYAWGSGFFIAAFACNCLKTASDRRHSWAPQNRQLAAAMAAVQAVTASVLLHGLKHGAIKPGIYAWLNIALAAAGAAFCSFKAATCAAAAPQGAWAPAAARLGTSSDVDSCVSTGDLPNCSMDTAGVFIQPAGAGGEALAVPLSSSECEQREHAEPEYAAFTSAAVLLLTLLQLAL